MDAKNPSVRAILNLLGLSMRAGKIVTGEKACVGSIRADEAAAVLIDEDTAHNAVKAVEDACAFHNAYLIRLPAGELGYAIGKPGRMVAVVTDPGLGGRMRQLNDAMQNAERPKNL